MSATNTCVFGGNVVRDTELKTSQGGTSFTNNAIAVNSGYGDNKRTDFFNFTIFGKRAESFCKFVQKGNRIAIQCEAQQRNYTDKNGNKVSTIDFLVNDWEFMQSKSESNSAIPSGSQASSPASAPQVSDPASAPVGDTSFVDIEDGVGEELPFN